MNFKVVKVVDLPGFVEDRSPIEKLGGVYIKKHCESDEEILAVAHDADFIIVRQAISRQVIEKLGKCRFIQTTGIGYDGIDVEAATENGIGIISIPDYCIEEVSDHVMALILACSRRISQLNGIIKAGKLSAAPEAERGSVQWRTKVLGEVWTKMDRLRGKTVGLVGFGRIARAVVPKAKGFGMNLITYDPYIPQAKVDELGVKVVTFDQLLQESDFLSLHTPLTSETRHLIGLEQLKKMKPSAYLINTARGSLVDEPALYEALTNGFISGAGLDVTEPEPPAPDSLILKLDNVVLTGHSAFNSPYAKDELIRRPQEEAARVMRGEWPLGLVNPEVKQQKNVRGPVQ